MAAAVAAGKDGEAVGAEEEGNMSLMDAEESPYPVEEKFFGVCPLRFIEDSACGLLALAAGHIASCHSLTPLSVSDSLAV